MGRPCSAPQGRVCAAGPPSSVSTGCSCRPAEERSRAVLPELERGGVKKQSQAQVRAGLKTIKEAAPSAPTDPRVLEKEESAVVILSDVVRPETQATQLAAVEDRGQDAAGTIGEVLSGRQLIVYRGMAVASAVAVLAAGVVVRVLSHRR
ncbi:hypothetical protein CB1_000441001 [Camelus ferus]|nr:hypothetical protein CB1_001519001 [Camelus ferus]EPY84821.1 hypothetical protein CB1_000441001 [Camelus ferus]